MAKKVISVIDSETQEKDQGVPKVIETEGYLLIYLQGSDFRVMGDMGLRALAPLLLEYIGKKVGG